MSDELKGLKHKHAGGRCAYDEYKLDEELRAGEAIQREVVAHLRSSNQSLLLNQKRILEALIETGDLLSRSLAALRVYRVEVLQQTERHLGGEPSHCVPNCAIHVWSSDKGWTRQ